MKTRSEKDVKRRITDQFAAQRISEETRDEHTPHEFQLAAHERKLSFVRRRRFWQDVAALMHQPR